MRSVIREFNSIEPKVFRGLDVVQDWDLCEVIMYIEDVVFSDIFPTVMSVETGLREVS